MPIQCETIIDNDSLRFEIEANTDPVVACLVDWEYNAFPWVVLAVHLSAHIIASESKKWNRQITLTRSG